MDNNQILQEIDKAMKGITTPDTLGDAGLLNPEQFDQFVRTVQEDTLILGEARYQEMNAQKQEIERIAFLDRVLEAGGHSTNLSEDDFAEVNTTKNTLIANELMAIVGLKDHTVRRNIERGNLQNTIIDLLGEAAGRDMEEYSIFADEDLNTTTYGWSAINLTNGWVKEASNKLYDGSFDDTADSYPENLFEDMLEALPKKYLQNRNDWRFYVTWEVENAYRNLLKNRGTALGDGAQTGNPDLYYKGIRVVYVPMLERYDDNVAMLQNPNNMVWGIFHEVTLETEREAKKRRTDFVLTFEGDAKYEDENACVVAIDTAEPQ